MRAFGWLVLGGAVAAAAWAGGCGTDSGDGSSGDNTAFGSDGGIVVFGDGGVAKQELVIAPANPVLNVTAGAAIAPQQFTASINGKAVAANWSLDNIALGTFDATGLFKPSGVVGGSATVTAQAGTLLATTKLTVRLTIVDNPGNLDSATQATLKAGGKADGTFAWLYPYDQTVFPRGLMPPTLQFAGAQAPTAFYVHITTSVLDYSGFFPGNNPARVAISAATWKAVAAAGAADPVKVEVTKAAGAQVTGPIAESWAIAQGSLKGTLYYNSYDSLLANRSGAILRVKPGANADVLMAQTGCTVCHAVSANGGTLVTLGGAASNEATAYSEGTRIDLKTNVATKRADPQYAFGGVYPDGSKMLSSAAVGGAWPPNVPGVTGDRPSVLIDLKTDATLPAVGLAGHMLMPSFAPDGKKVAFNDYDHQMGGSTLAVMDFDSATNTFANRTAIATGAAGQYLGWPAFTPDAQTVVYGSVAGTDYATWHRQRGDLWAVDVASKAVIALEAANGKRGGTSYLASGDDSLNYEPTALPLAVGGYYWIVFTSRRQYGNMIAGGDPWDTAPRKKLWIVAVDMHPTPGKDPSHPAIYLEGQEFGAGNMRGFWALDPCHQTGTSCESGDECCEGFCRQQTNASGTSEFTCVAPPAGCANEFEKCNVTADCCAGAGVSCIAGHCASSHVN